MTVFGSYGVFTPFDMGYTVETDLNSHFVDKLNINGLHYIRIRCAQMITTKIIVDLIWTIWCVSAVRISLWCQKWLDPELPIATQWWYSFSFISRGNIYANYYFIFIHTKERNRILIVLRCAAKRMRKYNNEEPNKAIRCIKFAIVGEIHG